MQLPKVFLKWSRFGSILPLQRPKPKPLLLLTERQIININLLISRSERKPKEIGILFYTSGSPMEQSFLSETMFWLFTLPHTRTHVYKQSLYMIMIIMPMVSCHSTVMIMCQYKQGTTKGKEEDCKQMFHVEGNSFNMFGTINSGLWWETMNMNKNYFNQKTLSGTFNNLFTLEMYKLTTETFCSNDP